MSNIPITQGTGASSVATETIATVDYQKVKIVDGTPASTTPLKVNADGSLSASVVGTVFVIGSVVTVGTAAAANQSVSGTVGASIIGTVPVTFASSVYGNISGSVVAFQGAGWSGSVAATITNANVNVSGSVVAFQGGTRSTSVMGGPITLYAPSASLVSAVTSVITSTSQTSVLVTAPGAQRNYITQLLVSNGAAAGTFVDIMDGPNIIYSGYAAASGGGFSASFPAPLKQTNTVQSLDMKARVQASIIVAVSGFTAA